MAPTNATAKPAEQHYTSFPLISTEELLDVLQEMGLTVAAEDIARPQPAMVQRVYMAFLDTLAGVTPEMLEKRGKEGAAHLEHQEMYEDGVAWHLFFREVYAPTTDAAVR